MQQIIEINNTKTRIEIFKHKIEEIVHPEFDFDGFKSKIVNLLS